MTPLDVLAWLAGGGFSVEARGGKLWVSPASQLSEADRALVTEHRDALLEALAGPELLQQGGQAEPTRKRRWEPPAQLELNWNGGEQEE